MLEAKVFVASGKKYCLNCKFVKSTRMGLAYKDKCLLFGLELDRDRRGVPRGMLRTKTCLLADRSYSYGLP